LLEVRADGFARGTARDAYSRPRGLLCDLEAKVLIDLSTLPITEELVDAALLPRSLYSYVKEAWRIAQPAVPFVDGWHIGAICEHLQAVSDGQIRFLWISIAPRHMKSWNTAVFWPTWDWSRTPSRQFVFAAYGLDLAVRDAVYSRRLIDSPWYQARWGSKFKFTSDQNVKTLYENDKTGRRLTASVEAGTTGHGGDILVLDDPLDIQKAGSDVSRKAAQNYVGQVFMGRMNDPRKSSMVGIAQRTDCDDVTAYCLRQGGWEHLCLPSEYVPKQYVTVIGWSDPRKEAGELLWPARFGPEEIARAKTQLGQFGFSSQHQQDPIPAGGGAIKTEWWRYYEVAPSEFDEQIQSWDCAFKGTMDSDYVVGQVWGRVGATSYLLDQTRARLNFPETLSAMRLMAMRWPLATRKLVEDKANGPAVISVLQREMPGIIPVEVGRQDKEARLAAVSPLIEAGNVRLPGVIVGHDQTGNPIWQPAAPWVGDFIAEHSGFPLMDHDDQVDACSQALLHLQIKAWGVMNRNWNEAKLGPEPKTLQEAHTRKTHSWIKEQLKARQGSTRTGTRLPGLE
jgi:predicted phage terminase large subunit-like protein